MGDQPSPFARAIDAFLSDIRGKEDVKSLFYREVLMQSSSLLLQGGNQEQSEICATNLSTFVAELDSQYRREHKTIWIMDKLRPLMTGLSKFSAAFDLLVQAGPKPLLVLYGGARLVLMLVQSFQDGFDIIFDIMEEIGHLLQCYGLFSSAYHSSPQMLDLLVDSYKKVVSFWHKASKMLSQKGVKSFLTGLIKPFSAEWQKCRQSLQTDCDRVQLLAQATEADMRRLKDNESVDMKQKNIRKCIADWILGGEDRANLDVRPDLREKLEVHHPGTCSWLYEHPTFNHWTNATTNSTLWYNAGPGTGKTILCSALAKHLRDKGLKTIYFFFSFNDSRKRKPINAIRSLALQLLTQASTIPDKVLRLYETEMEHYAYELRDENTAILVLRFLLNQASRVHIVLDGLDECDNRPLMIRLFSQTMLTETLGLVKWFYSSRDEVDLRLFAQRVHASEIAASPKVIMDDIKRFLKESSSDDDFPEECIDHWTDASEGNFLWMSLVLDILKRNGLTCDEDIEEELGEFPKGLVGCYQRGLQRLLVKSEREKEFVRRTFAILVFALQPLHLSELSNALGVRPGAQDFSSKALPKAGLIEEICGPMVVFDRVSKGSKDDPLIKLAHKTVQEFFVQDPASLGVPEELRRFFTDQQSASLDIGQTCLTYLSYARYQEPLNILDILKNDRSNDHAFLKYAATFWFWHVHDAGPSDDLYCQVKDLIHSDAFWNCLVVQAETAPHLFARYTKEGCGFYVSATGPKESDSDASVYFGLPLPAWLETIDSQGKDFVQKFLSFVKEWQPVLTLLPHAVNQCCAGVINLPSRKLLPLHQISTFPLSVLHGYGNGIQDCSLDVRVIRNKLQITLVTREGCGLKQQSSRYTQIISCRHGQLRMRKPVREDYPAIDATVRPGCHLHAALHGDERADSLWFLDSEHLIFTVCQQSGQQVFDPPKDLQSISNLDATDTGSKWALYSKSADLLTPGRCVAYHCVKLKSKGVRMDSGYGSLEDAKSDSDSDTESDSEIDEGPDSDLDSDADADSDSDSGSGVDAESCLPRDRNLFTRSDSDSSSESNDISNRASVDSIHCLVLASQDYAPMWVPWRTSSRRHLQIAPAFHPTEPVALWSHIPHELKIANLVTKHVTTVILPEPVGIDQRSADAAYRELRFSTCGRFLHYLLCSSVDDVVESRCSVALSSFRFEITAEGVESLHRLGPVLSLSYKLSDSLKDRSAPFVLTHWTTEKVYIALPPLSSCPKLVQFNLNPDINHEKLDTGPIQTLNSPVYWPSSTPYRSPQMVLLKSPVRGTKASSDSFEHLTLTLNSNHNHTSDGSDAHSLSPPVVMTWNLIERGGWREWNPEQDGRSEDLKFDKHSSDVLRGTFVDSEQRFRVPLRSGLDWTKKAFVSCS